MDPLAYSEGMPPRSRRTNRPTGVPVGVLGYVRVSTDEQVASGAGLDGQRAAITGRAELEGWDLTIVADEGLSAGTLADRPGLVGALERLDRGDADVLVAA